MHETIIATKIIESARKHGNIKSAVIEVGKLANITANELKEILNTLVDWDIKVIEKEANVKCKCGFEGRPKIIERGHELVLFECPKCSKIPSVIEGDKIILRQVGV